MANYLIPDTGQSTITPTEIRGRGDVISINNMYKMKIFNTAKTIQFTGFVPPDFSMSLSAAWTAPYGDTSIAEKVGEKLPAVGAVLNAADKALKFGGASSISKIMSAKRWTQPSYFEIDMPIFLDAYTDSKEEVVKHLVQLLSLCAPSESVGGILIAPGPSPFKQVANEAAGYAGSDASYDDPEAFTVEIGNFFSMKPAVVESVSVNYDNVFEDETGNPISCDFMLRMTSYFAVTRQDLQKWFKLSQTSTSGA